MPRPTPADRHVDALLSNVGMAYLQDPGIYVCNRVFPMTPVGKQSDMYRKYRVADLLRLEAQKIAPGHAAPIDTTGFDDEAYFCEKYGLRDYLTPEDIAMDDGPIPPDQLLVEALMQAHRTAMERNWATTYFQPGVWGNNWVGVAAAPAANQFLQFDAPGDPTETITAAKRAVFDSTGFMPNIAVIGGEVWDHLQTNAAIMDRIKYTGSRDGAAVTAQMLQGLWGLEEIVVAQAIYNAAAEGAAAVMTKIFGKSLLLAYRPKTPSPRVPSGGYTFLWNAPTDAPKGSSVVVRKIPRPSKGNRTDYEAIIYWDQRLTAADLGIFLSVVIS